MKKPNQPQPITNQEREVLQHLSDGKPNRHIADQMCLSPHTIKNHKANLKKKLGLKSTLALFKYALDWAKQKVSNLPAQPDENNEQRDAGGGKILTISIL